MQMKEHKSDKVYQISAPNSKISAKSVNSLLWTCSMQSTKDQIKSPTVVIAQSKHVFYTLEFNYKMKKKKKKERRRNNKKNETYIESRKQGNDRTCKIYGGCINTSRIKHHCHLSFWAYKECCAAIKKNREKKTSLPSERKAGQQENLWKVAQRFPVTWEIITDW